MRTHGRRAAMAATCVALLFAAAGTSLAAVRAARYEGARDAGGAEPSTTATGSGSTTTLEAGGDISVEATLPPTPTPSPVQSEGLVPGAVVTTPAPPVTASAGPAPPVGSPPGGRLEASPPEPAGNATVVTGGPISGPRPTTVVGRSPSSPSTPSPSPSPSPSTSTATSPPPPTSPPITRSPLCPSDSGRGATPPRRGDLRAVDFSLPWPGVAPLVLVPQASAIRTSGARLKIVESSVGDVALDGSSLTLASPTPTSYTLVTGGEMARGSIVFTPIGAAVDLERQACTDRGFVVYDVAQASLNGSPLRIVAFAAPTGTVTVDPDGGSAHFQAPAGTHRVTLLTANDVGTAGSLVTATVTVH